jgi:transcriptional regulator with XRE-family HTH domain
MEDNKRSTSSMDLRKRAGKSRMDVAVALGVTQATVAKWEQRVQEPHLPMWKIKRWAEIYGCPIDELISAFPPISSDDSATQQNKLDEEMHLSSAS